VIDIVGYEIHNRKLVDLLDKLSPLCNFIEGGGTVSATNQNDFENSLNTNNNHIQHLFKWISYIPQAVIKLTCVKFLHLHTDNTNKMEHIYSIIQ
jgi:hypothetical protein